MTHHQKLKWKNLSLGPLEKTVCEEWLQNSQRFVGERFYKSTLKGHSAIIQTFMILMTTRLDIITIILLFPNGTFSATHKLVLCFTFQRPMLSSD